jgi:hypothetical protein
MRGVRDNFIMLASAQTHLQNWPVGFAHAEAYGKFGRIDSEGVFFSG